MAQAATCEREGEVVGGREGEVVGDCSRLLGCDVVDIAIRLHDKLVCRRRGLRHQVRRQ